MQLLQRIGFIVLLSAFITPSFAVRSLEDKKDLMASDVRLDQKISYQAKRVPLHKVLNDLSEETGITLRAGYNDLDWQVRDRRMNIFVKDLPLRELMISITRVMKFKWIVNDKTGKVCYRLYLDRKTLASAEAAQMRSDAKYEEEVLKRRRKLVDDVCAAADKSPGELEALKEENPYLYNLAKTGAAAFMKSLMNDSPEAADAVLTGGVAYIDAVNLSPATQQLMARATFGRWEFDKSRGSHKDQVFPTDMEQNASTLWLRVYCKPFFHTDRARMLNDLGSFSVRYGPDIKEYWVADLNDPDSRLTKEISRIDLDMSEKGLSGEDAWSSHKESIISADNEVEKLVDECRPGEPKIEHSDEEWMHAKVKMSLKEEPARIVDIQSALAETSGMCIMSDSFVTTKGGMTVGKAESEIGRMLDSMAETFYYNWEKHGRVLEFRSRDWFLKRDLQVPEEWIKEWSANTKENGIVSLDDMAQICTLSDDQLAENLIEDEILGDENVYGQIRGTARYNRCMLGLYRVLTPKQKRTLWDGGGVNLRLLTPEQAQWVEAVTDQTKDYGPKMPWADDPNLMLFMRREPQKGKGCAYHMDLIAKDDYKTFMTLFCPEYTPADKKSKTGDKE